MKTIYKYPIRVDDDQVIRMPIGARIIKAGLDTEQRPAVWAVVETRNEIVERHILAFGTGNPFEEGYHYVDSFNQDATTWHIFSN